VDWPRVGADFPAVLPAVIERSACEKAIANPDWNRILGDLLVELQENRNTVEFCLHAWEGLLALFIRPHTRAVPVWLDLVW